jgi:hypothetical protein
VGVRTLAQKSGDFVICSEYKISLASTNKPFFHHSTHIHTHTLVFRTTARPLVKHLRELYRSRVVLSSLRPPKHFFQVQSSFSTMRASIILVGLSALAIKAVAGDTLTDTLSTTTTVTILSCHPTVTNCPVSPLFCCGSPVLRFVHLRNPACSQPHPNPSKQC